MTTALRDPVDRRGLTVGVVPGVTVTKWTRIWAERFPRTPLETVPVEQPDQRDVLDDGRVEMCFVRLPVPRAGLHLIPLYEEVPVVVVPKEHPASVLDDVTLADLADDDRVDPGRTERDADHAFDLVAAGAGVLLVPHSIARSHSRRDLVAVPVTDAEPTQVGLAWLVEHPNALIEEFVGVVRGRTVNSTRSPSSAAKSTGTAVGKQGRRDRTTARPAKTGDRRRRR